MKEEELKEEDVEDIEDTDVDNYLYDYMDLEVVDNMELVH